MDERELDGLLRVLEVLHRHTSGEAERKGEFLVLKYPDGSTVAITATDEHVDRITLPTLARRFQSEFPDARWVLICLGKIDPGVEAVARVRRITLVPVQEIYRDIGETIVRFFSTGGTFGDLALVEAPAEVVVEEVEVEEEEVVDEEADVIPIFLEEAGETGGERYVKLRVGEGEVKLIGSREVGGTRAVLIYVPFHVFEYSADVYTEGEVLPKTVTGYVGVNASVGPERREDVAREWKYGLESTTSRPPGSEAVKPRMDVEDARKLARDFLLRTLTKEKEITRETKEVVIIERRKVFPDEKTLKLSYLGTYYMPLWRVSGRKGTILVDGITGEILARGRVS